MGEGPAWSYPAASETAFHHATGPAPLSQLHDSGPSFYSASVMGKYCATRVAGMWNPKERHLSFCNPSEDPFLACCHIRLQTPQPEYLWNNRLSTWLLRIGSWGPHGAGLGSKHLWKPSLVVGLFVEFAPESWPGDCSADHSFAG